MVKPTDVDFERACVDILVDWKRLRCAAQRFAAERLLQENQAQQKKLIEESDAIAKEPEPKTHREMLERHMRWERNHAAIDRAFKQHDRLLKIAYPVRR